MPTTATVDRVVEAWELYSAGSYQKVTALNAGGDVADLVALARLEMEPEFSAAEPAPAGLFGVLLEGMAAYHAGDHRRASEKLGAWLERKAYFTPLVLERFLEASESAEDYRGLYNVGRRFLDRKRYHGILIGPLVRAAFHLELFSDCAALFDNYRQSFRDPLLLHRTALALLQVHRHKEAEQILLAVYRKITGKTYDLEYEKVAREYQPLIRQIPDLEQRAGRDQEEEWQLGMAYLFNKQFDRALKIFQNLQTTAA